VEITAANRKFLARSRPAAGTSEPRDFNFMAKFFHFLALNRQKSATVVVNKVLGKVIKMR